MVVGQGLYIVYFNKLIKILTYITLYLAYKATGIIFYINANF